MRTISALNPRMPLCWRGVALWPDAIPSILAEGFASRPELLGGRRGIGAWRHRRVVVVGIWPFRYTRHDGRTPAFAECGAKWVIAFVLWAESAAAVQGSGDGEELDRWHAGPVQFFESAADSAGDSLIDLHISAFIAARADRKIEMQVNGLAGAKTAEVFRRSELVLLRDLQARYHPAPMPALAKWVAARLQPGLQRWRNKPRREAAQARLDALSQAGFLARLLDLVEDPAAWALDSAGAQLAAREKAIIDAEMAAIDTSDEARLADAERFGRAIAGGIGLSAFILMVMSVLLR